ncbi:MAG: M1 family metallopeptidase [Planctomycetota bacterium]
MNLRNPARICGFLICAFFFLSASHAQVTNSKYRQADSFRQLEEVLPTPTETRLASGAPGPKYWQQRADYVIDVEIDDENQRLIGREQITYRNQSPHKLTYIWLQLDANIFAPDSDAVLTATAPELKRVSTNELRRLRARMVFDGSMKVTEVSDSKKQPLKHTIVKTMMRIDMPQPLAPGETFSFNVAWNYKINNSKVVRARTGCEYFEDDKNYLYEIAHWFPRLVAYTDYTGWQHKQFIGRGEFTLELGDYLLRITVPDDHIVASSGVLMNGDQVLTAAQRERLEKARTAKTPVFIVTPEEAEKNESNKPSGKKTWIYKADNVRDVAFATSRKFIWDAQLHKVDGNEVMAMSYYPKEGEPLWSRYSTHSIIHTLDVYSRYTFNYPYPVAISVNGPVGGMEYPMICFNGPRPEEDGTYSKRTKYGLISVIIHEVGHNYFPMIVNSDERQWTWMDEGLNTFLQYLSEQEWEEKYPSRRGEPQNIVGYMRSQNQVPIMTNSESILQFGANAYAKPATALNILRESILGRELFDFAFKEYARRWKFKRPTPADFFRTMEDASGVDLDWFWRGWFYSTDHTDLGIDSLSLYTMESPDPKIAKAAKKKDREDEPETLSKRRNKPLAKRTQSYPELKDFYNDFDELDVTPMDEKSYKNFLKKLEDDERELLEEKRNFYVMDLSNVGGLVMPVIIEIEFEDGSKHELRIPAEIWRRNNKQVKKLFVTEKVIKSVTLDPHLETADVDLENNHWPRKVIKSRFQLYKDKDKKNDMQKARGQEDEKDDEEEEGDE